MKQADGQAGLPQIATTEPVQRGKPDLESAPGARSLEGNASKVVEPQGGKEKDAHRYTI